MATFNPIDQLRERIRNRQQLRALLSEARELSAQNDALPELASWLSALLVVVCRETDFGTQRAIASLSEALNRINRGEQLD